MLPPACSNSLERRQKDQPRDRLGARRERAHGGPSRAEHLHEAARLVANRRHGIRVRTPARLTAFAASWSILTTRLTYANWLIPAMSLGRSPPTVIRTQTKEEIDGHQAQLRAF